MHRQRLRHSLTDLLVERVEVPVEPVLELNQHAHLHAALTLQAEEVQHLRAAGVLEEVERAVGADARDQRHQGRVERPRARPVALGVHAGHRLHLRHLPCRQLQCVGSGRRRGHAAAVVVRGDGRFGVRPFAFAQLEHAHLAVFALVVYPRELVLAREFFEDLHRGRGGGGGVGAEFEGGGEGRGEEAGEEEDVAVEHRCGGVGCRKTLGWDGWAGKASVERGRGFSWVDRTMDVEG